MGKHYHHTRHNHKRRKVNKYLIPSKASIENAAEATLFSEENEFTLQTAEEENKIQSRLKEQNEPNRQLKKDNLKHQKLYN